MDSDFFWDAYQEDIKTWSVERILHESNMVRKDYKNGMLDEEAYNKSIELLEAELYEKMYGGYVHSIEAYDRAMQGV